MRCDLGTLLASWLLRSQCLKATNVPQASVPAACGPCVFASMSMIGNVEATNFPVGVLVANSAVAVTVPLIGPKRLSRNAATPSDSIRLG